MKNKTNEELNSLPYPTRKTVCADGKYYDEYIIPKEDKEEILRNIYPFFPIPKLDEIFEDIFSGEEFSANEFRIIKGDAGPYLVSPSGGNVLNCWKKLTEEEREYEYLTDINYDAGYHDAVDGLCYGTHKYSRNPDRSTDFNNGICSAYDDGFSWGIIERNLRNKTSS